MDETVIKSVVKKLTVRQLRSEIRTQNIITDRDLELLTSENLVLLVTKLRALNNTDKPVRNCSEDFRSWFESFVKINPTFLPSKCTTSANKLKSLVKKSTLSSDTADTSNTSVFDMSAHQQSTDDIHGGTSPSLHDGSAGTSTSSTSSLVS